MLERKAAATGEERNSRKSPLTDSEARELLGRARRVIVAKGKKVREMAASEAELDDLKGPTGNYRAPMVLARDTLLVGFNAEALEGLV